jgi:4-amino-4-deoxy-L-arabinose transferase-like glycosyltransferase
VTAAVRGSVRDAAVAVAVCQVAAIFVLGALTVARFHIFAAVDERAHVAYVQEVAEHGRLPWLGRSYVSWQELAIEEHTYPRRSAADPRMLGLRGSSYEAWQPPLYYALAVPAFMVASDYRDKIRAVRALDLVLLMAAVAILAALARTVFKERWPLPYCLALTTLLWPGVLVRAITVSNAALEIPLVLLYVLVLWRASARPRPSSLIAAGGVLGLCVLTQLTLACLAPLLVVPIVAAMRKRRNTATFAAAALAVLLPLLLIAPWLASNESRYGALTASSQVERLTEPFAPSGPHAGFGAVTLGLARLRHFALPQEWWPEYKGVLGVLAIALPLVLLLVTVIPLARLRRVGPAKTWSLLAGPFVLGLGTLIAIVLVDEWPAALFPRYLNPMLPPLALFSAGVWMRAHLSERTLLGVAALSSLVLMFVWVDMVGAYYFTNAGATLGIHAAAG